jgi:hypothetical protein
MALAIIIRFITHEGVKRQNGFFLVFHHDHRARVKKVVVKERLHRGAIEGLLRIGGIDEGDVKLPARSGNRLESVKGIPV